MKKYIISGLCAGFLNGLLGAGGGMILVPILQKLKFSTKECHANSIAIILPTCLVSTSIYIYNSKMSLTNIYPFLPWGILGSLLGVLFLTRLKDNLIKKIFALFMLWAAVRMIF